MSQFDPGMPVVKLDEDLSGLVAGPLLTRGYQVRTVHAQGWNGLKDPELWPRVLAERVFWITGDKGFGDLRTFKPGTPDQQPGILVLRPNRESIVEYAALLENVVSKHQLAELVGCISVATPRGLRIRRPATTQDQ